MRSKNREYLVKKGDSLHKIAEKMYGKGFLWRLIYQANKDIISDPDKILPGQILEIPKF